MLGTKSMKCLNCVIENFAFNVCFEDSNENDLKEKTLFLVFENGGLEVFPTVLLSSIDEKIALLNDFINRKIDEITVKFGFDDLLTPPYIDYINTVVMNLRYVEENFVKISIDLLMYDSEYKGLCQFLYKIGLDALSVEDLTISRNYTYLTTLLEVDKFNEYLKSYKNQ